MLFLFCKMLKALGTPYKVSGAFGFAALLAPPGLRLRKRTASPFFPVLFAFFTLSGYNDFAMQF